MRYRYAKYGYYIPGSEFTVETYCPSCQCTLIMTVLGDGTIQLQCNRCNYNARYDSYESLRRCSRVRERVAKKDLNHYCKYRFEAARTVFAIYTLELARVLGVPARPKAIQRALAKVSDMTEREQLQADAETHAWNEYERKHAWYIKPTPLAHYYFAQLRNHYGY